MKNRAADIDDVPFLPPHAKKNWEKRIPKIWTGETVWCESAVKAMRYMGRDDLAEKVNYEALYIAFVTYNHSLRKMAYALSVNKTRLFLMSSKMIIKRYKNVLMRIMKKCNIGEYMIVRDCENIEAAIKVMNDMYCDKFKELMR